MITTGVTRGAQRQLALAPKSWLGTQKALGNSWGASVAVFWIKMSVLHYERFMKLRHQFFNISDMAVLSQTILTVTALFSAPSLYLLMLQVVAS